MTSRATLSVCLSVLPLALSAADLDCTIETLCTTATGCEAPEPALRFGLRIAEGAVLFLTDAGAPAGFGLTAHPGEGPDRMRVYTGPDGSGFAVLTLRDDGAITLSTHAGRMVGPFANDSTLSMGRCEVPA